LKSIFSPIFLTSLLLLFTVHHLDIINYHAFEPFVLIIFLLALVLYVLKKFKTSYVLIALSIGLLLTTQFIKEKDAYYQLKGFPVPADQYISIEGKLKSFPEIKNDHSVILLETESLEFNRKKFSMTFNIRIRVNGDLKNFYRGDTIAISARVYPTTLNKNFFANPIENYLLARKNHFNGYCKSTQLVSSIKKTSFFWKMIGAWRNKIRAVIEEDSPDEKGVFLQAILIGERGKLTDDQEDQLLNAGVFHLIAISGAHIGIIALFSLGFLRFLRVPFKPRHIITAVLLIIFLVLSGFKISAERAVLMAIFIFIARIFYLDIDIYNIISFCGLVLLARNPGEFLDAGFILTFTLTAAIVMGRKIFLPLIEQLRMFIKRWRIQPEKEFALEVAKNGKDEEKCGFFCKLLQRIRDRAPTVIIELLSANFSASLMALPLSLFLFKRYSFAGFISGLLLVPLTFLITGLGILLIPLAPLWPFLAKVLLTVLSIPLGIFFHITAFFSDSIHLNIYRASPSIFLVLSILIVFFLLSETHAKRGWHPQPIHGQPDAVLSETSSQKFAEKTKFHKVLVKMAPAARGSFTIFASSSSARQKKFQKIIFSSILLLLIVFVSVPLFFYSPGNLEVFFLDVGQGDSHLVVFPGGDALLIDGGGAYYTDFQVGRNIVLPFILEKRINVKWIAISHYHPDHAYGVAEIIDILKPGELWISSETPDEPGYKKLFQAVPSSTRVKRISAPFSRKIGECTIELLYPDRFIRENRSSNNHSQVLKISDQYHSFLFTGDIEKGVEADLKENVCSSLRSTVIKVPHHGSASSSSPGFLECVNPRFAIFSYALNNRFGFPHRKVLDTYQDQGIKYLSTGRSGGIRLISLPNGIKIETSK
jgi:competence protein ComEC